MNWYKITDSNSSDRFESIGTLFYSGRNKVALNVDLGLAEYYRSTIPKSVKHNRPKYKPHITVVRSGREVVPDRREWGKHAGERISFQYDPFVYMDNTYIWLKAYSNRLQEIRKGLGLPAMRERFGEFHITIANRKNIT
jgi:hypothetical protein